MNIRRQRGFTLVEVLVTIAIIIILAGILVGGISFAARRADEAKTIAQLETLAAALEEFRADRGYYPKATGGLEVSLTKDDDGNWYLDAGKTVPMFNRKTKKSYLKVTSAEAGITDAWGNPFHYKCPGDHNVTAYDLLSYGMDGAADTAATADPDDITNWNDNNK